MPSMPDVARLAETAKFIFDEGGFRASRVSRFVLSLLAYWIVLINFSNLISRGILREVTP
jgi:hypothetical protein